MQLNNNPAPEETPYVYKYEAINLLKKLVKEEYDNYCNLSYDLYCERTTECIFEREHQLILRGNCALYIQGLSK